MKRSKAMPFLLCALMFSLPAGAVKRLPVDVPQANPVHEAWRWQFFSEADGLASVRVNAIVQADSAVWFATDRGLSRYDGIVWRTFTEADGLPGNDVRAVAQAGDGTVWAGTADGLCRYDGAAWRTVEALPRTVVNDLLLTANGGVWAATDSGAAFGNGSAWEMFTHADGLADSRVNGLALGTEGRVWFATDRGVSRYDGIAWQSYRKGNGLKGTSVTAVYSAPDGALWFAQYGVGVSRFKDGAWTAFDAGDGLPDNLVRQVFQTPDGTLWALCRSGLARLEAPPSGAVRPHWQAYGRKALPGLGELYTVGVDAGGAMWVRGARGVARFDYLGKRRTTYVLSRAVGMEVGNGIGQDRDGTLWLGTDRGALRYDGAGWTHVLDMDGQVRDIFSEPDGALFLLGRDGVLQVRGMVREPMRSGLEGRDALAMCRTRDGALWVGTDRGLFRWGAADARWIREPLFRWDTVTELWVRETEDEPGGRITALCAQADGKLWAAGSGNRLCHRNRGGLWTPGATQGPGEARVLLITPDGSLWLAYGSAGGGVTRWHPDGELLVYSSQDGLGHDEVHALVPGEGATVWAGTASGLAWFNGEAWTPVSGLQDLDVRALFRARDGALWMRTAAGEAVRYWNDRAGPKTFLNNPPASVAADGNVGFAWEGRDRWLPHSAPLAFSYRLDGREWSLFSERERTPLFALPDGPHTFEVRARDADLNVEATPAIHRFAVEAPIWKRPWFLLLTVGLLGAVGIQTRRILMHERAIAAANEQLEEANERLQEVDRLKTEFFSSMSHELRTPMAVIKGYVDNMLDGITGELNERQQRYLDRIKSQADRLAGLVNDLLDLSRIDRGRTDLLQLDVDRVPVREVVSEAVESLRQLAEEKGLALTVEGVDAYAKADPNRVTQVVVNLVNNAIKFTEEGGVSVTVKPDDTGYVQTIVKDTGPGIPEDDQEKIFDRFYQVKGSQTTQPGTGLGLPISKDLVELQGGKIWVQSTVGAGSTFTFTLPEMKERQESLRI